jgi:hypothetical protein
MAQPYDLLINTVYVSTELTYKHLGLLFYAWDKKERDRCKKTEQGNSSHNNTQFSVTHPSPFLYIADNAHLNVGKNKRQENK